LIKTSIQHNVHTKGQFEIMFKFFFVSKIVSVPLNKEFFFTKHSSASFLPLLVKFGLNSATNSSGQLYFSAAPFEFFGRKFGHLVTKVLTQLGKLRSTVNTQTMQSQIKKLVCKMS
jgi:hypothetical protein